MHITQIQWIFDTRLRRASSKISSYYTIMVIIRIGGSKPRLFDCVSPLVTNGLKPRPIMPLRPITAVDF